MYIGIPVYITLRISIPVIGCCHLFSIRIYQLYRVPSAIRIGANARVLVRQWVNAEPHGHQLVVHVPGAEITISRLLISFFPGEYCRVTPREIRARVRFSFMCYSVQFFFAISEAKSPTLLILISCSLIRSTP